MPTIHQLAVGRFQRNLVLKACKLPKTVIRSCLAIWIFVLIFLYYFHVLSCVLSSHNKRILYCIVLYCIVSTEEKPAQTLMKVTTYVSNVDITRINVWVQIMEFTIVYALQVAESVLEFWNNFVGAVSRTYIREVEERMRPFIDRLIWCLCMLCKCSNATGVSLLVFFFLICAMWFAVSRRTKISLSSMIFKEN